MSEYILKKFDEPILAFTILKNEYEEESVHIKWITPNVELLPERVCDDVSLTFWLRQRMIPRNRAFVNQILSSQGLTSKKLEGLLSICMGLSVNDVYWVTPIDFEGKFDQYNLYDNSFSEALSLVAFTGYSTTLKELSPSPEMTTNGMLPKAWRRIDNKLYLYKGGTNAELYTNAGKEPYIEYYATQIANELSIDYVPYSLEKWKGILASVCENFTTKDISFVPAGHALKNYTLSELVNKVKEIGCYDAFKDMILFDALINNEDRHFGNFGFLKDNQTNTYIRMAPIFDNGVSLFCYLTDDKLNNADTFNAYRKEHNLSALDFSHDELVMRFCDQDSVDKLIRLDHFQFQKHEKYNLPDERLHILDDYIQARAKDLIQIIQSKKLNIQKDVPQENKIINIQDHFLGYHYQFTGSDTLGGRVIIMDSDNTIVLNINITANDISAMDAVTYIEDRITDFYSLQKTRNGTRR